MSGMRRLNEPVRLDVRLGKDGRPAVVAMPPRGRQGSTRRTRAGTHLERVECVLDTWHVDDAWWTDHPVRRICHELQLESGTRCIVSWDLEQACWYVQR